MSEQEAAGLLADESFINYCFGTNAQDAAYWENYARMHPHEKETLEELKTIVLMTSSTIKTLEAQSQLEKLKQKISYSETMRRVPVRTRRRLSRWAIAASFAGILVCGAFTFFFLRNHNTDRPAVANYVTKKAERKSFVLPDGTTVTLNAESTIELGADFNQDSRTVMLNGEAFFDVVHNASVPFVVRTEQMDVKVLGTAFNVRAYAEDRSAETSLIRGRVELSLKQEHKTITLSPNEKYLIRMKEGRDTQSPVEKKPASVAVSGLLPVRISKKDSLIAEVSWVENKLVFVDERFEDLVQQLSRWYGVPIEIKDPALNDIPYTASFRSEGLEDVLAALQFTKSFNFENKNGKVMIYK